MSSPSTWLHGPMDKALVYGTRDSGFDPQWSRFLHFINTFLTSFQCFSWTLRQALPPPKKEFSGTNFVIQWQYTTTCHECYRIRFPIPIMAIDDEDWIWIFWLRQTLWVFFFFFGVCVYFSLLANHYHLLSYTKIPNFPLSSRWPPICYFSISHRFKSLLLKR